MSQNALMQLHSRLREASHFRSVLAYLGTLDGLTITAKTADRLDVECPRHGLALSYSGDTDWKFICEHESRRLFL